ncbi:methylenetetrahydrofolate reductase [Pumilibacter muris]|uniref:methylenetetrahydrofolate reductase n=1 Tax=Pumilibacter muris TaxID=2941510 RepID=UPI00203A8F8F|nr:methylenetetrahydrofolate reductase [Pumilibacter muris]
MRIDEILKNKRTLSFEVFPPKKSGTGTRELFYSINELKTLKPDFISVTYGAGGSNARNAAEIAGYIKSVGVEPLAHITGGPSSPQDIDCVCKELSRLGVENVLCLRGDKPAEYNAEYCKHFPHATDLIKYIEKYGFTAGAACYPEGHVECETLYADLENLKKKEACGAKFFITQIFYDNSYYYRLLNEARRMGITAPLLPGIMPLTSAKNIARIKSMCGSTIPIEFRNMLEIYSEKPAVMREIGLNYAVYQIIDLIAKGAPGIHLYIMNRADTAAEICQRLRHVFNEYF